MVFQNFGSITVNNNNDTAQKSAVSKKVNNRFKISELFDGGICVIDTIENIIYPVYMLDIYEKMNTQYPKGDYTEIISICTDILNGKIGIE